MILEDFNAKSIAWGSPWNNACCELIAEFQLGLTSSVEHWDGNHISCVTFQRETVIDLSWVSSAPARPVTEWLMMKEIESLSNRYINMEVLKHQKRKTTRRNFGWRTWNDRNGKEKKRYAVNRVKSDAGSYSYRRFIAENIGVTDKGHRDGIKKLPSLDKRHVWCCDAAYQTRQTQRSTFLDDGVYRDARHISATHMFAEMRGDASSEPAEKVSVTWNGRKVIRGMRDGVERSEAHRSEC